MCSNSHKMTIKFLLILSSLIPGLNYSNSQCIEKLKHQKSIYIAVAANFTKTLEKLATNYQCMTGIKVKLISGSTGKLYAQIVNGAPYDIFFSADAKRAKLLVEKKLAEPDSNILYASGKLVLWLPGRDAKTMGESFLHQCSKYRIAIANPKLAPYGFAAEQVLNHYNSEKNNLDLIIGENINQAFNYVFTNNVDGGLVSMSSFLQKYGSTRLNEIWEIPKKLYAQIGQYAVLLTKEYPNSSAADFLKYIQSTESKQIISSAGYKIG